MVYPPNAPRNTAIAGSLQQRRGIVPGGAPPAGMAPAQPAAAPPQATNQAQQLQAVIALLMKAVEVLKAIGGGQPQAPPQGPTPGMPQQRPPGM